MPESRSRKSDEKTKVKARAIKPQNVKHQNVKTQNVKPQEVEPRRVKAQKVKAQKVKAPSSRRWVPPTFITVGLLGVAWLITYYVAGPSIPLMSDLGNWNILIGMGGMAAAFGIATLWR